MPYIATDLDAFDDAQSVAGATGLSPPQVLGGLALTWRYCWRNKVDRVTAEQVAAFFCSPLPGLPGALVAFGFLADLGEHGFRVRGVERYLHISAARSAAGKVRAANAKRSSDGRLEPSKQPAPSQHVLDGQPAPRQQATSSGPALTATSDERISLPSEETPRAAHAAPPPLVLQEQRQKRTRKHSRQEVLYTALAAHRAETLGPDALPDEPWSVQRQNEALGGPILECEPGLLLAGLRRFLESPFAGRCDPPGPLGVFVKQWSRWVSEAMRESAGGVK